MVVVEVGTRLVVVGARVVLVDVDETASEVVVESPTGVTPHPASMARTSTAGLRMRATLGPMRVLFAARPNPTAPTPPRPIRSDQLEADQR